jgi:uncharacterized protein
VVGLDYLLNYCHWRLTSQVNVFHTVYLDMGLALSVEQFHQLADRLRKAGVQFIIEPHLRFEGQPGEQYTMFFKDPSGTSVSKQLASGFRCFLTLCVLSSQSFVPGNNLEFKAMTHPENLFAKYNVADK